MKILKVWDSEYPWDVRVEKISSTLLKLGHDVILVCRNRKQQPEIEDINGLRVHRLPYSKSFPTVNDAISFPAFFNPFWIGTIGKVACRYQIDAILVRDLPLALSAVFVAKRLKIPVVLDMAEPYPEMIRLIWRFQGYKLRNIFLRNPFLADMVEHLTLKFIDHVIVVVEESKKRLVKFGVSPEKVTIITNATSFGEKKISLIPEAYARCPDSFKMIYLGLLGESRGLQTVINAMPLIIRNIPNIRFYIIGTGSAEALLKSMVKEKKLEQYIIFLGWVENSRAEAYIKHADVAVIPHFSCGHWNHTIPNKLFDYMAYGIPVVASDVVPMRRIIKKAGCGVVFASGNHASCAAVVVEMQDQKKREKLGKNGKIAVAEKYQWNNSGKKLARIFN